MARELTIEIRAESQQAEEAFARVEDRLKGVEQTADKAGDRVDDFGESAGGAAKEATTFGRALERIGGPVGAGALAGAAILIATKAAIDFTANIAKAARNAEVSTDAMQGLDAVARKNGSTFDVLSKAMFDLDAKLVKGGKNVIGVVEGMGESVDDLLKLSRDERFRAVAVAISNIEDPAERARAAVELLGGQAQDLMPILRDLANGVDRDAPKMSRAWIDAGDEMKRAWDETIDSLTTRGMQFLSFVTLFPVVAGNWARDWGEAMRGATGAIPALPGRPESPLLAAPSTAFDPLNGQSMAFVERQLTQGARSGGGTRRPGTNVIDVPQYVFSGGTPIPLRGSLGFPGFTIPGLQQNLNFAPFSGLPLAATPNLNFAPYAGTVPMNAPGGGGGGFFRGTGGRLLGMGAGMLSGLIPGMSGTGSAIGSGVGSAIGSIGKIASSAFGAFLGPLGGIAGGLLGKVFGGLFNNEGKKTNRTRDAFISENFGSVDALRKAAEEAGFSVDRLLSVKKVKDFESEVAKLDAALGEHARKREEEARIIEELNAGILGTLTELTGMGADIDGLFGPALNDLREMGRLSEDVETQLAAMSSGKVDFRKMDEAARRLGITDTSGLGQNYQDQRIGATASQMVNDIDLLIRGGADLNAVLGGSKEKISELVVDAMKFGTELPAQMKPWIEQLAKSGDLVDENGDKLTDVSKLKFGAPIETEFDKLIKKLDELIVKLSGPLVDAIGDVPDVDVDVNVNYNRQGDPTGDGQSDPPGFPAGGVVGRDWRQPSMADTLWARVRPGEVILTPEQARGGVSVSIGNISVGAGASRGQTAEMVGKAVVAYMERRGVRFGRRVA